MIGRTYLKVAFSISIFFVATGWAGEAAETIYLDTADGPYASNPIPADGAVIPGSPMMDDIYTTLDFTPGDGAASHEAFFSDDPTKVTARDPCVSLGPPPLGGYRYYVGLYAVEPYTESLVRGTKYYWCVDETDGNNVVWEGPVWSFYLQDYKAFDPIPPNEATFVETDVLLCWSEPLEAQEYNVYIGTDWNDVNNAPFPDPNLPPYPVFLGTVSGTCVQVTGLAFETKYYWRVDAVSGRFPPPLDLGTIYKGDVWCFTTVSGEAQPEFPADGAVIDGSPLGDVVYTRLDFIPGASAVEHTGYFSDNYDDVANRIEDANLGPPPFPTSSPYRYYVGLPAGIVPGDPYSDGLIRGTKYYWTVDEKDAFGQKFPGDIWEFTILGLYASEPDPPNEATFVSTDVLLSWQPGFEIHEHDVYIGTSWEDVNNARYDFNLPMDSNGDPYVGPDEYYITRMEPNVLVTGLVHGVKYYWRIDEVWGRYPFLAATYYIGDVWCFTTIPQRIYVDMDAGGSNNGTSWENAYNYLQNALTDAGSLEKPIEIWVAEGIYKPDQGSGQTAGDRTATFQLINGVTLKGGYAGFGETNPNARDIELYETILNGDLSGNDVEVDDPCDLLTEPTRAENSYHVITGNETTDENTILDGFVVIGGNAHRDPRSPDYLWKRGGGMSCTGSSPTVTNCTFVANTACWGAGMLIGSGRPIVYNCKFCANAADHHAGALEVDVYSISIINCDFIRNFAAWNGGAVWNFDANPPYINCVFSGNVAGDDGGAIWNVDSGGYRFINCTFTNNTAGRQAGAIDSDEWPMMTNCIFWSNHDSSGMGESAHVHAYYGPAAFNYSCVQGWTGIFGGIGNIDADPCFADPCNGDYHLKSEAGRWDANSQMPVWDDVTSPCIDAGNPGCLVGDERAPNGNRINMGAYGGTAEASKSPANWRSIADMTNDWVVDSNDLRVYVDYWLESGQCLPSDFDHSQFVDFDDFAIFGLHWSYPSSGPGMTFHIGDCTMEAGRKWTAAAEPNQPRFSVWVEGRYIYFEDQMYANCCPEELGLDKEINGNEITLYEIGYGGLCDCMCYFPITATLGPFEDGTYTVEVYDNYGSSLGIVEVTIGGSPEPTIIYKIEDCKPDASGVFAAEPLDQTRFTVTVEGPYIHFEDIMTANCCPDELGLEMTVEDNLITVLETEYTPGGCYCICGYPVTATLGPFEPGIYTLEVYEEWGGFIGSTTFVIEPPE